jgi:hypothetical protein
MSLGKTPITDFGDTDDADAKIAFAPEGFGSTPATGFGSPAPSAVTPSFSKASSAPVSHAPDRTAGAAATAAGGAESLVAHSKESSDWINTKWRPAMGWLYMATCFVDFVIFPILWSILQTVQGGQVTSQWQPLTLQGAGLYHIAMGAVLGIAAYGRTKEKLDSKQ